MKSKLAIFFLAVISGSMIQPASAVAGDRRQAGTYCDATDTSKDYCNTGGSIHACAGAFMAVCPQIDDTLFARSSLNVLNVHVDDAVNNDEISVMACAQGYATTGVSCGSGDTTGNSFTGNDTLTPSLSAWTGGDLSRFPYLDVYLCSNCRLMGWVASQ